MRSLVRQSIDLLPRGTRGRWTVLLVVAVAMSALELFSALLIVSLLSFIAGTGEHLSLPGVGSLAERFPGHDETTVVVFAMSGMGFVFLARGMLTVAQSYAQSRIAFNTGVRISDRLLRAYFAMPYPEFVRRSSGEMIRNAHELPLAFASTVLIPGLTIVSEVLTVLAIAIVLVATAPYMTAFSVAVLVPIVWLMVRTLAPRLTRYGHYANDMAAESLRTLSQSLQGMREIRVFGKDDFFIEKFRDTRVRMSRSNYLRSTLVDAPRLTLETTVFVVLAGFVAVATWVGASTAEMLKVMGIFAYGVMRAIPSLNRVLSASNHIRYSAAVVETLHSDLEVAEEATAQQRADESEPVPLREEIYIDHVWFRYTGADRDALQDVDIRIGRGESIGIVGPTGAGKSTLADVIVGLVAPTSGALRVDGVDVADHRRSWQREIGVVSQMPFLIDDTVLRNIALGVPDDEIDVDAVNEALQIAQLSELLSRLPDGLESMVGERGITLSGGERQRVSVARALYRRPPVLVFDEGTSALDMATEAAFVEALDTLRSERTIVTIAHRLSTVERCDRLCVVVDGRVVAQGPYDVLLEEEPAFRRLAFRT